MWTYVDSRGHQVSGIKHEDDARRMVHTMGVSQWRGAYSWDVTDNTGHRFVAEIKYQHG